ncbi:hypothetical protein [Orrella marina]|nr:hypothetical protein [Orrella marina]
MPDLSQSDDICESFGRQASDRIAVLEKHQKNIASFSGLFTDRATEKSC